MGVVRSHLVGPLRAQFVRRAIVPAAPERADNVAVGAGEPAFAVVAEVGGAARGAGPVAHDRFGEGDEQDSGVCRVLFRRAQGPLGAADHRLEVVGECGRRGCEGLGEVELQGAAGAEDGGRDRPVVVVALGQPERRLRNGLFGAAGLDPAQVEVGAAVVLEVLDLDVVGLSGGQLDGLGTLFAVPVVDPVVDEELSADPEAEAVVADDREGVRSGGGRHQPAGPADADVVRTAGRGGQPGLQVVEVEVRVEGRRPELVEVEGAGGGLRVVLALETAGLDGIVGQGGSRGQTGEAEEGGEQ